MGFFDYDRTKEWRDGVYLCSVKGAMTMEIIEAKLRSEGIPSERRYKGFSNCMEILLGQDFLDYVDLYVPADCLEDARNLVIPEEPAEYEWPEGLEPDEEESAGGSRPQQRMPKIKIKEGM